MQIPQLYTHLPRFVVRVFHSYNVFAWSPFQFPIPIAVTPSCSHCVNNRACLIQQSHLGVWDSNFCETVLHILIHRDGLNRLGIGKCGFEAEQHNYDTGET